MNDSPKQGEPEPAPKPTPSEIAGAALLMYALLLALLWIGLDWFDELERLPSALFVDREPWIALAIALPCAFLGAVYTATLSRLLPSVRAVEQKCAAACGTPSDFTIAAFSMLCATAEGLCVRYWLQDWRGYLPSLGIAVGMSIGPGFWRMWPVFLGIAALLGGMVALGSGLASSILAHALILYWSLRRILSQ